MSIRVKVSVTNPKFQAKSEVFDKELPLTLYFTFSDKDSFEEIMTTDNEHYKLVFKILIDE